MNKRHEPPDVLYRGFDSLEHASAFVNEGSIRFGWLNGYRDLEDASRRDQNEGTGVLRPPAPNLRDHIPEYWEGLNRVYVLCCSGADPAYVASKYGRHLVRINNPEALIADIRSYVSLHPVVPNPEVWATWVRYDRDACVPTSIDVDEGLKLAYSQKSPSYEADQEYRIALLSLRSRDRQATDLAEKYVFVKLNRPLGYCDLLPNHPLQATAGGCCAADSHGTSARGA